MTDPAHGTPRTTTPPPAAPQALRIWPAIVLLAILWVLKLTLPMIDPTILPRSALFAWFMGPLACAVLIVLWWVALSRARAMERILGLIGVIAIAVVMTLLSHPSVLGAGTLLFTVPWGITGFAAVLVGLRRGPTMRRTWLALAGAAVGFGAWTLMRIDSMTGDMQATFSWRWEPTAEERFLEGLENRKTPDALVEAAALAEPEWPGFRGPRRDSVQAGITLAEDWKARPLREVWRILVGPGWSSFAIAGDRLFTQEQRGESEVVVSYDARSGAEIWTHEDATRFWEAMGGAGPRATPTLADGQLFTLGATGRLHRLDPLTGEAIWERDIGKDAGREPPLWGFTSSPLVVNGAVVVHAGGSGDLGLLAYDVETGELRWSSPAGDHSYSSPQRSTLAGRTCVSMLTNAGITFVDPSDGRLLGRHDWKYEGYRVVQPLVLDDSSVLIGTGVGAGTRRISVSRDGEGLATEEVWTSRGLNPDFNDSVAHEGYLYGFDRNIFACIDLSTGERKWKRGRYGSGQVLLLPDANQLLVLSETGEAVLLRATPESLVELTRQSLLSGRTWNHPVLVGDRLYVRNSEGLACFRVPTVSPAGS